ncbi:hypothetical protein O181_057994, partial [Austropuccinia psidii MF-1]|nr:hypothetical protein [Austropuccinia psidii MF-1]
SEVSESSIEIQTSPAPRGLITKEPFKGPAEVEVTNPSNKMDLDQDIQVINLKDKIGSQEERHKWKIPELAPVTKDRGSSEGLDTHVLQRTSPTDKSLVEKPKHFVRGPEEEVGPRKGQQPSGSSLCLHKQKSASTIAKQGKENQKEKSEGKAKGKVQVEQALPTKLQNSQEREDSHEPCVQYGKESDGIQKQGGRNNEPMLSKKIDLSKLNLEYLTGHNAALFQEQLEKIDKARPELKKDIQSSTHNISLKNELPRQSTPILDRNVWNLINELHHTISSNEEVETACNFKEIPRLKEWPTFSGKGEYNHMEFIKPIDMLKEDFNIPD